MHTSPLAAILIVVVSFAVFTEQYNPYRILPCRRCETAAECEEEPPQICMWGEGRDACNRRVCLKGPGEKCGGKFRIMGTCGDGMMCANSDSRCHGCYIPTMTCYPEITD